MKDCVEPLVSVIVPVYNAGRHLYKCLDSLVNQTLRDIEIITVLDCPTDGSDKVVEEFAANDSRIKIIRNKENLHIGNSRNEGLKVARGKYIGFSDHDDYSDPRMYEVMYRKAEEENLDLVCSPYVVYRHTTDGIETYVLNDCPTVSAKDLNRIVFETTIGPADKYSPKMFQYCTIWNKLFKSNLISENKISFVDTKKSNSEDICFILEYTYHSRRAGFVALPLYFHNTGIGNTGAKFSYYQYQHTMYYLNHVKSFLETNNLFDRYKKRWEQSVVLRTSSNMLDCKTIVEFWSRIKLLRKNFLIVKAFKDSQAAFFITPSLKKKYLYRLLRLLVCSWNIHYETR